MYKRQIYDSISGHHEEVSLQYISHAQRGPLLDVIQRDRMKDRAVGYSLHGVHRCLLYTSSWIKWSCVLKLLYGDALRTCVNAVLLACSLLGQLALWWHFVFAYLAAAWQVQRRKMSR